MTLTKGQTEIKSDPIKIPFFIWKFGILKTSITFLKNAEQQKACHVPI